MGGVTCKELRQRVKELEQEAVDRKRAERALRESEQRLSQIVEGNSIPTFVINKNHTVTHWNRACERLTGIAADEMVGTQNQWMAFYTRKRPVMADLIVDTRPEKEIIRHYGSRCRKSTVIEGAYEADDFFSDLGEAGRWLFFTAAPLREVDGNIIGAVETLQDITDRKSYERRLQYFSETMIRLQEEERTRISRELHDELGQVLTGLKLDAAWLDRHLSDGGPRVRKRFQEMSHLIDHSIHTVREIATDLRPRILDDMGLETAVEWHASEFQRRSGIECVLLVDLPDRRLARHLETGIYRIVQEALTNVARHSHASMVTLRIKEEDGMLLLHIADNGDGIDATEAERHFSAGISGMRERAEILSGSMEITGVAGEGTHINVRLPITYSDTKPGLTETK